jgi:hypothetical protein
MTSIEGKMAYPYITKFKKEPFNSFVLVKRREIGNFFLSSHNKVREFYQYFNENLLKDKALNLENVFWFLLLKKYLKEDDKRYNKELYNYIIDCAFNYENKLGFKFYPNSKKLPDIWSTYFALASLKLLGLLKEYLTSDGTIQMSEGIKSFVLSHKKGKAFLHCLEKDCEIEKETSPTRTLYFIIEIFTLLGVDVRLNRQQFQLFLGDRKRDSSIIFKLLNLKFLNLDLDVKDKEIQYLLQFQKENGGFSFKKINGRINTTFWLVYVLDIYSWFLDYNPIGIYSFINSNIIEILSNDSDRTPNKLMDVSKLIILLSIIWKKFISEIERVIFKQIEQEKYIDLKQIKTTFGLTYGIEEVISYINSNYTIKLKILDNKIEFNNFIRNLSQGERVIIQEIYEQLSNNSVISLSDIHKKYKNSFSYEPLKLKEHIFPLIYDMVNRNFFKGKIIRKRKLKTKFFFYLDFLLEKIIVSDTEINLERLYYEKDRLKDIKNDIFNMILKLKNISLQIKEEIESYLILDEISYAKERLKFILRSALMDADFLNENIENSFNLDLYYVNIQTIFKSEIAQWTKLYSVLSKRLNEIDRYLQEKIAEKENLRNLNLTLENLDDKINTFSESINKKINDFKKFLRETNEKPYSDKEFSLVIQEFEKIKKNVNDFDKKILEISQKIITKEEIIQKIRNRVIHNWVAIYEDLNDLFEYYSNGFNFFKSNLNNINKLSEAIDRSVDAIRKKAQNKIKKNQFQKAFKIIKTESDELLNDKTKEIKVFQEIVKNEMNSKQKLYLLYRHLQELLDQLEENVIETVANQVQSLKNKVIEERNRAKIEDFDRFVSQEISKFKAELFNFKKRLEQSIEDIKIKNIIKEYEHIQNNFDDANKSYLKKLNGCKEYIKNFGNKNVTIMQWENFKEYFKYEINILKDEQINEIIKGRINLIAEKKKTNNIKILDLKKELGLKCKVLLIRIKDMIDISKLNAELYDAEKYVLLYTEHYYKNKELRNFIDNKLLRLNRDTVGKILALYDSSIRKRTLNVNMLELQNRINDLNLEENIRNQFNNKIKELQIQIESREEYNETKIYLESIIENNKLAINSIQKNLKLFIEMQNFIEQEFNNLNLGLIENSSHILDVIDNSHEKSYLKIKENFETKWKKLANKYDETQEKIEEQLKLLLNNVDTNNLSPEIGEFFVKKKKVFMKEYNDKKEKIIDALNILKDEAYREKLLTFINNRKIYISQLLGTLQTKVEDDIDIKEFKRANLKIQKRAKNIETYIKSINKSIKNLVKEYNKQSKNFKTKNKYILDDFNKFINEFYVILTEKVKSLEQLITKSYVEMVIKAVANEFLTLNFLYNELKIKKDNIQNHLIYLISEGKLKGKYNPRLGLYYENPDILNNLDEDELEVFKKMNFKLYMFVNKLKHFVSQYGGIFAFFAAILSISYTIFRFSGENPAVAALPMTFILVLLFYFFFKQKKDKTI